MGFFKKLWGGVKDVGGAALGYYTGGLLGGAAAAGLGGGGGGSGKPGAPPPGVDAARWKQQKELELKDATRAITKGNDLSNQLTDQQKQLGWQAEKQASQQKIYNEALTSDIGRIGSDREALLQLASERGPSAAQAAYAQSRDDALRATLSQAANAGASGSALANRQAMQSYAGTQAQAAQGLQQGLVAEDLGFRQQQLAARETAAGIAAQQAGLRQGQVGLAAQQFGQTQAMGLQTQDLLQQNLQARTNADLARQGYLTQGNIAGMQNSTERRGQDLNLLAALIGAGGSTASSAMSSGGGGGGGAAASDERMKKNVTKYGSYSDERMKNKIKTIGQQGLRAGDDDVGKKSKASFDQQIATEDKADKKRKGFWHVLKTIMSDVEKKQNIRPMGGGPFGRLGNNMDRRGGTLFNRPTNRPNPTMGTNSAARAMTNSSAARAMGRSGGGMNGLANMGRLMISDEKKKQNVSGINPDVGMEKDEDSMVKVPQIQTMERKNRPAGATGGGLMGLKSMVGMMSDETKKANVSNLSGSKTKPRRENKPTYSKPAASAEERDKNRKKMQDILAAMGADTSGNYQVSDEEKKANVQENGNPVDNMLDRTTPVSFNYTPEAQRSVGEDGRRNYGVMAQDLEKSNMGKSLVVDTPKGKMVDTKKATMANMAANARLHERISGLEDAIRSNAVDELYGKAYANMAAQQMQEGFESQQPLAPVANTPISPNAPAGAGMADQVGGALQQGFEEEDPLRAVMRQRQQPIAYGY